MTLLCRRDEVPCEKLDEFFSSSVRKISDAANMQRTLLLEKPTVRHMIHHLKTLRISASDTPIPGCASVRTPSGEVPHRLVFRLLDKVMKPIAIRCLVRRRNLNIFSKYMKHFIAMRYGCSISSQQICEHFEIPTEDHDVWLVLFNAIVYTLLSGLAVLLLRKHFRWCECRMEVPSVRYFSRAKWKQLKRVLLTGFLSTLVPIEQQYDGSSYPSACCFEPSLPTISSFDGNLHPLCLVAPSPARLLVKKTGQDFRLVVNANCRQWPPNCPFAPHKIISVNQRLRRVNGLAEFLYQLRSELPSVYSPSMPSVNLAFKTLLAFRSCAHVVGHTQFWFAKLDILDCFHNIDHVRLLDVFEEACSLASKYMYPVPNMVLLKQELLWFLKQSTLLFEGKQFAFARGIPQGSCISSDLASLYLAHADRTLCGAVNLWCPKQQSRESETLIIRYLDDYLCVSTDRENLVHTIELLKTNAHRYGLHFNKKKVHSNLDSLDDGVIWLGMKIRDDLTIVLPKTEPPTFCRYAGLPLSAEECLMRLRRTRPNQRNWHLVFQRRPKIMGESRGKTSVRCDGFVILNAIRLGFQLADMFWIFIKSSPQRALLLRSEMCKRLAGILKCKLRSFLGPRQWRLHRVATSSFIHRLHPHRGELVHLFHAVHRGLHSHELAVNHFSLN